MTEPSREEALLNYAREKVEQDNKRGNGNGGDKQSGTGLEEKRHDRQAGQNHAAR